MQARKQDVSELFRESGINKKVVVATNEHMYTLKDDIEDNWLLYTFFGFRELNNRLIQEGKTPKRVAIIGTGNGVDALGAYFIIDGIEELLITDIDPRIMEFSVENIQKNISDDELGIYPFVGDLCKPISERGLNVNLVYGNLPNLPSDSNDLLEGLKLSSLYKRENSGLRMPSYITAYLLEMQMLFLDSAKAILNPGGSVLPIIGGRVPYELFPRMFAEAGLSLEELCSGFKRQTEPDIVILEYAGAERDGIIFSFYPFTEAKEHLKKIGVANPTTRVDGMELSSALRDYRISAREALNLYREGIGVGHTVHFFRGTLNK
ncbi:MAG: hypothetical protein AABX63_04675 [Nanoarchaeota archaeon]